MMRRESHGGGGDYSGFHPFQKIINKDSSSVLHNYQIGFHNPKGICSIGSHGNHKGKT
jgi:hypothetical protein